MRKIFISNALRGNCGAQNGMGTIIATLKSTQEKDHLQCAKFY